MYATYLTRINSGILYVTYGTAGMAATTDVHTMTAAQGFRLFGSAQNGMLSAVAVGDVNGDGQQHDIYIYI